jgi:type II secretory pathway pseudopilin PulG
VEVLVGILIVVIAAIGTLSYFSYGLGGIGKEGLRRAAMERARQRLDQLMEANLTAIAGANLQDGQPYWLTFSPATNTWNRPAAPTFEGVTVDDLPNQPMETTVQLVDDPTAGTTGLDVALIGVKVWFTGNAGADDDHNRVYVKTLRALF